MSQQIYIYWYEKRDLDNGTRQNKSWHIHDQIWEKRPRQRHTKEKSHGTYMIRCRALVRGASFHTIEWVTAHTWISHGTHMNESRHICEWVMSHIWISHGTHMDESCHKWDIAGLVRGESCRTLEWVTTHLWMSHVTHMNESWHKYE